MRPAEPLGPTERYLKAVVPQGGIRRWWECAGENPDLRPVAIPLGYPM